MTKIHGVKSTGLLRKSVLILVRSTLHPDGFRRDRYFAYDRKTKKLVASAWRAGRLRQLLREKGYRWPRAT